MTQISFVFNEFLIRIKVIIRLLWESLFGEGPRMGTVPSVLAG